MHALMPVFVSAVYFPVCVSVSVSVFVFFCGIVGLGQQRGQGSMLPDRRIQFMLPLELCILFLLLLHRQCRLVMM